MDLSISPREERMMEIREVYLKIKGKWIQLFSCPGYKCYHRSRRVLGREL